MDLFGIICILIGLAALVLWCLFESGKPEPPKPTYYYPWPPEPTPSKHVTVMQRAARLSQSTPSRASRKRLRELQRLTKHVERAQYLVNEEYRSLQQRRNTHV